MRKFLIFSFSVLMFSTLFLKHSNAQVVTELSTKLICYNTNASFPVIVQNMNNVDNLRLAFFYDESKIKFIEYYAINSALTGGAFKVSDTNDSLVITWSRTGSATIVKDTLVWLRFKGLNGSTDLKWNSTNSYFHTVAGNSLAIFVDGQASVNPKINIALTELNPTCMSGTNNCQANYLADASGGKAPYTYLWNGKPSQWEFIQKYLCSGTNRITVTDASGCKADSNFIINGLPGAKVKLIIEGNDDTTIYLQNPVLTFSFREISPTHVVDPPLWEFGDGDTARSFNPTHTYEKAITNPDRYYDLKLHVVNDNGCDSTINVRIPIKEAKLKIPGVITPNGDSFNESFMILNQNKTGSGEDIKITNEFQSMELLIFDRWGRKVYESTNYQNDWSAKGSPDGTYYYVLKTIGFYRTDKYKGSITVLGSGITQ